VLRALIAAAACAALAAHAQAASAAPGEGCFTAYEGAQASRQDKRLVRAKSELELCIGTCPQALAGDCRRWLAEIEPSIARLVVAPRSETGEPVPGAIVHVDGLTRAPDAELELDPGSHTIRVEAPGRRPVEERVELEPGARSTKTLTLTASAVPRAPDAPAASSSRLGPFLLGGAGIAALGTAGVLSLVGWLDVSDMRGSCAPEAGGRGCPSDRIDRVRTQWIAAGALTGVGAAMVAGAGTWLFLGGRREPPKAALSYGVEPHGASLSFRAVF
jgi:hypothetical protein